MQTQFSLSKNKLFWSILALVVLLAIPETRHVLADYLGPNRKVVTREKVTVDVGVWAKPQPSPCYCKTKNGGCADACIVCSWEGSPGKACGDATYSYKTGTKEIIEETISYLPEATISGTLQNCNLSNGWCTNHTTLLLTAIEPVDGYSISIIEGTMNGITFACTDLNNCVVDLVAGDNTFTYWANSSYGDGSQMGTVTAKVDAVKPDIVPSISGTIGENGWFIIDVTATFSASDPEPGSGLNTFETSLDNASWTPYVSSLVFTEGQHHLYVKATDFAANVHSLDDEIKVDTSVPTISGTISGTLGGANWYVTAPQASVTVADTMSGIASVEYNADGADWQPYSTAVTFDDGPHTIQFRTYDFAGWSAETEIFSFQVDTTGPSIKLPSRWYIWESADFVVKDDQSKVVSVSYAIRDGQNRWKKVERNWTPNTHEFSRTISWNRVFADGITAPIGSYPVRVYAEDAAGNVSWKDAEIVIPGVDDPPLPTFTPTPTAEPTEEVVAPPADATAIPTPIPPVSEEDNDDEETAPFVFGGNAPDDTPDAEPEAPAPSSSVLWGAAAAAAIGTYQATMAEKKRREEEATARKRASHREKAARREAEKSGRLGAYIREMRKAKEAAAKAKEERIRQKDADRRAAKKREQSGLTGKEWKAKEAQQAIWDANGAAIWAIKQTTAAPKVEARPAQQSDGLTNLKTFGELTPWEAGLGGRIAQAAHFLSSGPHYFEFWGDSTFEDNNDPPWGGFNVDKPIPMLYHQLGGRDRVGWMHFNSDGSVGPEYDTNPNRWIGENVWSATLQEGMRITDILERTENKIPFVCGDVPDWAYYAAGHNLQAEIQLLDDGVNKYTGRWPRASYAWLDTLYQPEHVSNTHTLDMQDVDGRFQFSDENMPELGDVIVYHYGDSVPDIAEILETQRLPSPYDNDTYLTGANHVVVVSEIHGNTLDKIVVVEGNTKNDTTVKQSLSVSLKDAQVEDEINHLIYGHPNLPGAVP